MNEVLAVIGNYKRPQNVQPIIDRMASQPCDVVVADNSPADYSTAWENVLDVWRWRQNSGPPFRWYPALAWTHRYRYVLMIDDDHMPRLDLVESLLGQSAALGDQFAVIGRIGRNYHYSGGRWCYRRRNVRKGQVDMAGAGYWVRAETLMAAFVWRDKLANLVEPQALFHDDIILNCAVQATYGVPSWMPESGWSERRLPTYEYAFNAIPSHEAVRERLISACERLGWTSIREIVLTPTA